MIKIEIVFQNNFSKIRFDLYSLNKTIIIKKDVITYHLYGVSFDALEMTNIYRFLYGLCICTNYIIEMKFQFWKKWYTKVYKLLSKSCHHMMNIFNSIDEYNKNSFSKEKQVFKIKGGYAWLSNIFGSKECYSGKLWSLVSFFNLNDDVVIFVMPYRKSIYQKRNWEFCYQIHISYEIE